MLKLWEMQFLIKRINEIYNPLAWSEVHDTHISLLLKPQKALKANSHTYQWKCSSSSISIWPRKKISVSFFKNIGVLRPQIRKHTQKSHVRHFTLKGIFPLTQEYWWTPENWVFYTIGDIWCYVDTELKWALQKPLLHKVRPMDKLQKMLY